MKAIGMNYPIESGQQGYFEQTFESLANEKVKLRNLMNTKEGERYMQPTFGLGLQKYLFDAITDSTKRKIESEIKKKVSFWIPNIMINNLYVDISTNVDRNEINVEIDFSLKSNPIDYDVVSFLFTINQ